MNCTKGYQELQESCADPRKRKRMGRGRLRKGKKVRLIVESSSAESPMKRVTFDLTAFSDEDTKEIYQVTTYTTPNI